MTIRRASEQDAARIAALITLAYRVEAFFVDGDRTSVKDVLARMKRGHFLVMEDDEQQLVGCVFVEARGKRGYFGMLSVDPDRQRQGLGARLVAAAEAWALSTGRDTVEIEVVNLRTELPLFYRRLGYEEEGIRPFPDGQRSKLRCHFIVMTRRLQS